MKILHLLSGGSIGGIEVLCRDIADLGKARHEFCFLYSGGEIADEMQKKNQPIYRLYEQKLLNRMISLIKIVKSEQYDIIVVHHEGIGIYTFYLMLTCLFKRIKFIKYLHCSFEEEYFYEGKMINDFLNYRILKKVLKRSSYLVAVSEFVKNSYCEAFHCDRDKVTVIYNGIRFLKSGDIHVPKHAKCDEVRLLYIGRLIEVKGIRLLIGAMKKLIDAGNKFTLTILGEGAQYKEYVQLVRELKLENNVFFEGYQMNKQPFYQKSDIFVYPSVWQEAFGIAIVEALAQGMVCVASISGGIPEIIQDGVDGFLFERGNAKSLTETLLKASNICHMGQYDEMAEAAKKKAKQFDVNFMIDDLESLCKQLSQSESR